MRNSVSQKIDLTTYLLIEGPCKNREKSLREFCVEQLCMVPKSIANTVWLAVRGGKSSEDEPL